MDSDFTSMSALLNAVWPAVAAIDWADYCGKRASPYDNSGLPKYTGLLMHRSGTASIGATTVAVGFIPRPEQMAKVVTDKTRLLASGSKRSGIEMHNSAEGKWGGAVRSSVNFSEGWSITMLPEIGDHLLLSCMMHRCGLLSEDDWHYLTRSEASWLIGPRNFVDMSTDQFDCLRDHIDDAVRQAMATVEGGS
ncbi:MAG: hypothetical protein OXF07_08465 [Rhodobacter sp.]|nr:hypothetical protein [Rhodobacter sp.]